MENRSFDHLLGWLPGRRRPPGRPGLPRRRRRRPPDPSRWRPTSRAAARPTPTTPTRAAASSSTAAGATAGCARAATTTTRSATTGSGTWLPGPGRRRSWTTFSRYFAGIMAETYPEPRSTSTPARPTASTTRRRLCTLPTIWDRLAAAGLTGRYYFTDVPVPGAVGRRSTSPIGRPVDDVLRRLRRRHAARVSLRRPALRGRGRRALGRRPPARRHPQRRGVHGLDLQRGHDEPELWSRTVLLFNFDEWGGFYDHVPPPTAPIPAADAAAGNQDGRLGFRVPCLHRLAVRRARPRRPRASTTTPRS